MIFPRSALIALSGLALCLFGAPSASAQGVVFNYEDPDSDWPELGEIVPGLFAVGEPNRCGSDLRQSPIDIPGDVVSSDCEDPTTPYVLNGGSSGKCKFDDLDIVVRDIDVGAGIFVFGNCEDPPTIKLDNARSTSDGENTVDGKEYTALQFHVHTGSEHTINGYHGDAELHIVHANLVDSEFNPAEKLFDGGDYQVIGTIISGGGSPNPFFEKLLQAWEATLSDILDGCSSGRRLRRNLQQGDFDVYKLIPQNTDFYTYPGSLTAPPCSESVYWNLATEPLMVSWDQVDRLFAILKDFKYPDCSENDKPASSSAAIPEGWTSRPPQPLNGRVVKKTCG